MQEIQRLDTEVIAIASRDRQDVRTTQETLKPGYTLVPGPLPELFKQYGAYNDQRRRAFPATILIDRHGVIRWQHIGKNDNDRVNGTTVMAQLRKL